MYQDLRALKIKRLSVLTAHVVETINENLAMTRRFKKLGENRYNPKTDGLPG